MTLGFLHCAYYLLSGKVNLLLMQAEHLQLHLHIKACNCHLTVTTQVGWSQEMQSV